MVMMNDALGLLYGFVMPRTREIDYCQVGDAYMLTELHRMAVNANLSSDVGSFEIMGIPIVIDDRVPPDVVRFTTTDSDVIVEWRITADEVSVWKYRTFRLVLHEGSRVTLGQLANYPNCQWQDRNGSWVSYDAARGIHRRSMPDGHVLKIRWSEE